MTRKAWLSPACALVGAALLLPLFAAAQQSQPTAEEARAFVEAAEKRLSELSEHTARAAWVQNNFITYDTQILSARAREQLTAATTEYAQQAARFDGLVLPYEVDRKLKLLKLAITTPAPTDPAERAELTRITTSMPSDYGSGRFCDKAGKCFGINELERLMGTERDPARLQELWEGWRTVSAPMRPRYQRFVELTNKGARELGYKDAGAMWRSKYDMPPDEFAREIDRLWNQLRPLYESLHAFVRGRLSRHYGPGVVPPTGPIPAHLLGNMWAQSWGNTYHLLGVESDPGFDLTHILRSRNIDETEMVRYAERFFTSLGFDPLPKTFWDRSLFVKPRDRDVVCHASAWNLDSAEDLRIKMCIEVTAEHFQVIHHELGHNFYQRAYNQQPPLFRGSANDGFHEATGDLISLSVTPEYLQKIGLLEKVPGPEGDIGLLMKDALDSIAFIPFGLLVDQYRWKVFSGEVGPDRYNQAWWELRTRLQGVAPPSPRTEDHFDPGGKYHVPANVPYTRYFLARVLQFQFHRALCRQIGHTGPLNRCSIYNNREAGKRLNAMLEMGQSRPWPEALEAMTGEKQMDATAIMDYFAPLKKWLDEQNRKEGNKLGW
jgi:peptidyl-dipeptidase A